MLLVVDDNELFCKAMKRAFRICRLEGECFGTWTEARQALEADPARYDRALIDVGLPQGESGLDAIEWIREHHPHIRCVLTSGARRNPFFQEEPPHRRFLSKPFGLEELLGAIS